MMYSEVVTDEQSKDVNFLSERFKTSLTTTWEQLSCARGSQLLNISGITEFRTG
jgi:hypothetical protein